MVKYNNILYYNLIYIYIYILNHIKRKKNYIGNKILNELNI